MEVTVIFTIFSLYSLCESSILFDVKDFIAAQRFPTKVSALVCWKAGKPNRKFFVTRYCEIVKLQVKK